jgi:hypothetical protein
VSLGVHFAPPNDTLTPVSASNLNQASIAIGKLAGIESITRRVKNVDDTSATYTASVDLDGFDVEVTPSSFTLAPGAEQTFEVQFTRTDATLNEWAIGSLTWTGGGHAVRSPIAVQPVTVSAPVEVHGDTAPNGSAEFEVTPGFTGSLETTVHGLVGVTPVADSVVAGPFDTADPVADADTKHYAVEVPVGTMAARFSLDSLDDTADLDLFVYKDGDFVDLSASGAADEQVTILDPEDGTYDVYVNGFATPGGSTSYEIANFVLPPDTVGNASVTPNPASVTVGEPLTLTANWTGLDATKRWFGAISYAGSDAVTYFSVR